MTETTTLTLTRRFKAAPGRVYDALIDPRAREVWGTPGPDMVVEIGTVPPAVEGARETALCGPKGNPYVTVQTDWLVLEPATRVAYAETLQAEGAALAITLANADIVAGDDGTRLDLTLQILAYAPEVLGEVEGGWTAALEGLDAFLAT
ncbi:SRPBCC domain-containing protein [Jannaschia sp. M317]|uniref:SRPBCC domain-containing protein n=1 Tax=Jannaschia sp. M317 TaxID=2867011 RepID=UPI0021A730BF|nr:SRPBCC domain-containing protein [Jannaschia sp. M317]UWQ17689.1 SRPBCC domain-containing protein [Jannaschia sp. M317]